MNYLGHLFLSRNSTELMPGVFLGDHIKGILKGDRPEAIETGIKFHRAVDVFVDSHPMQAQSIQRLPKKFRRYGGIICDVVYDHYLANHWQTFCDDDFELFCTSAYQHILRQENLLNESALRTALRMQEYRSLEGYRSTQYIDRSLSYIGQRLKRDNPLSEAFEHTQHIDVELTEDFVAFLPDVDTFAKQWLHQNIVR